MKKLVVIASGVAAAIGFSVAICSPAQAEPFVPCPYDPDGGVQAWQQWYDKELAKASALDAEYRTKIQTLSGAERMAYAQSVLDQSKKLEDERSHPPLSCQPLSAAASAPYFKPDPLQPVPDKPLIADSLSGPPSDATSPVDCTKLKGAYDSLGPVSNSADAAAKLNHMKIPGVSQVTGASLALCGLDAIPAAIANPTADNQQRVFDGACGAVDQFTGGIINPCGDTPVGSN